ncbi:MAG: hypothetical protein ACOZIN_16345 [Myxococcota bacterium]
MNCPSCDASVPDDVSICPQCDYIIDASFLGSDAPPETDDEPALPPRPRPRARPTVAAQGHTRIKSMEEMEESRSQRAPHRPPPARRSMPEAPPHRSATSARVRTPSEDWHPKQENHRLPRAVDPSERKGMVSAEEAFAEAKSFMEELSSADKLTMAGLGLNVLTAFFPWKETAADGEELGLLGLGLPVLVMTLLAGAAVVMRVRRAGRHQSLFILWLTQLGAVGFCIVWCLIFIKVSWNGTIVRAPVGNFEVAVSKPVIGVFIALVTSVVALGGTLMGFKEKQL